MKKRDPIAEAEAVVDWMEDEMHPALPDGALILVSVGELREMRARIEHVGHTLSANFDERFGGGLGVTDLWTVLDKLTVMIEGE